MITYNISLEYKTLIDKVKSMVNYFKTWDEETFIVLEYVNDNESNFYYLGVFDSDGEVIWKLSTELEELVDYLTEVYNSLLESENEQE